MTLQNWVWLICLSVWGGVMFGNWRLVKKFRGLHVKVKALNEKTTADVALAKKIRLETTDSITRGLNRIQNYSERRANMRLEAYRKAFSEFQEVRHAVTPDVAIQMLMDWIEELEEDDERGQEDLQGKIRREENRVAML